MEPRIVMLNEYGSTITVQMVEDGDGKSVIPQVVITPSGSQPGDEHDSYLAPDDLKQIMDAINVLVSGVLGWKDGGS